MGASAGRVLLISKGDWNAQATYTGLDWVRHNGAAWVCKNTCTNIEPNEANSDNWQMMARDGDGVTADTAMSDSSTNAVQNKVIKSYVDNSITGISDMTGATATQNGAHGFVPAPQAGDEKKVLLGDGTWGAIDDKFSFADHDTATSGTSFTNAKDGNMLVTDWTKNLLNPTLETTTANGVTCTNNGDGTYTFNGTATDNVFFDINKNIPINKGTEYKAICFKDGEYIPNKIMSCVRRVDTTGEYVFNNGSFVSDTENCWLWIKIAKNVTVSNLVVKPMITTDLDANYDDFVPYSGYDIKTCGKNLVDFLKEDLNANALATYTINNEILDISCNETNNSGVYFYIYNYSHFRHRKFKISFDAKASIGGKFNIGAETIQTCLLDVGTEYERKVLEFEAVLWGAFDFYNRSGIAQHLYIKDFMIEIVDEFDGIPTPFEPYTGETITVTNETESPAFGLKSHKGITNIISPGNVKCVYPTNESGKGVLDAMYNNELSKLKNAIFTYKTKEEYDTAVDNNEIPDGATVIKDYDD